MFITLRNQILKIILLLVFLGSLALHLALPINLTAVDIGRHIKNGELVLAGHTAVLYKNYYSFTHSDYPFINHHWFFGIIAYFIFHLGGFGGLEVFYILLLVLTALLSFDSARRYSSFNAAMFFGVLGFLLLSSRCEIRPEGVSIFFTALDFWLLQRYLEGSTRQILLLITIPLIQFIWVNTHIFFFLGFLLVALCWWQARLTETHQEKSSFLKRLFILTTLVNLLNPSGLSGMLTPLNGFKKFGYDLAENQSVFFMIHRFGDVLVYKYYLFAAAIMIVGMIFTLLRERTKGMPLVVLGALVTLAGFKAVRLFMPFGFLFVPLSACYYAPYLKRKWVNRVMNILTAIGMVLCFYLSPVAPTIGLSPGVNGSAEFFKENGLRGPIFSNYDIGGYLIYHLEPQERVFVDNRQEAFPPDFFRQVYIPMQEDPAVWKSMSEKYGFNVIYFYRHDITPWGQDFLVARIQDPLWAPVFVDDYTIIFARRGSIDQGVIDRFELPKSMFGIVHNHS